MCCAAGDARVAQQPTWSSPLISRRIPRRFTARIERGGDLGATSPIERRLRVQGIADGEALQLQPTLDARGERILRECLIKTPQLALQRHRLGPALRPAEVVQGDTLTRDQARRACHPAATAQQHDAGRDVRRGGEDAKPVADEVHDREQASGVGRGVLQVTDVGNGGEPLDCGK